MADDFDPHRVQTPARRDGWHWLAGRSSRREYWVWIAIAFGLSFALSFVVKSSSSAMTVLLLFAQIRRLHDIGRTGWLALAATLAPLVVMIPAILLGAMDLGLLLGVAIELALLVWIGALPGDPGDNRFGPPPPVTLTRILVGRG